MSLSGSQPTPLTGPAFAGHYPALTHDTSLSPETRLWIYTASRPLTVAEAEVAQLQLENFVRSWTAHNQALRAQAELFDNQFLILAVDESRAGASGCSIDKSVHFLEQLGEQLGLDWFGRMRFGWLNTEGQLQVADRSEFAALLQAGAITNDTLVVNTLVQKRGDLAAQWLVEFVRSWHRRLF